MPKLIDTFAGDDAALIECIEALIELNDDGKLVPHGIGGHARKMLAAAAVRLSAGVTDPIANFRQKLRQGEAAGEAEAVVATLTDAERKAVMGAAKTVSGGTRVSYMMTAKDVWESLESKGLLRERTTACLISSYLSDLGLAVRKALYASPQPTEPSITASLVAHMIQDAIDTAKARSTETQRIVAWLRGEALDDHPDNHELWTDIADAIERGEHLAGERE